MAPFSEQYQKFRKVGWIVIGITWTLLGVASSFLDAMRLSFWIPSIVLIAWAFHKIPYLSIKREGNDIVFRNALSKREHVLIKPATAEIRCVIEWYGYEGLLYDIVWEDGDVWTLTEDMNCTRQWIERSLQNAGISDIAFEKKLRVFRNDSQQTQKAEQTGPANPRPCGTSVMSPADSASRAGATPEASGDS